MLKDDIWNINLYYLHIYIFYFFCCYNDGMVGGEVWLPWPKFFRYTWPAVIFVPRQYPYAEGIILSTSTDAVLIHDWHNSLPRMTLGRPEFPPLD